jgi:hypothetical protein
MATPDSIVIRWRTDLPTNSTVDYGVARLKAVRHFIDRTRTVEHVVRLTGLRPGTRYHYAIGSTAQVPGG